MQIPDNFGLSRVIEPRAATPVTAWKVDNRRELSPGECRLSVTRVHLDRDNFQQLCSECGLDEAKIIAKVLDLIQRRGKLQNPITQSAGLAYGIIDEMGPAYLRSSPHQLGDELLCVASLCGIPLYIDTIHSVDYNYGALSVSGYAILFAGTPVTALPPELKLSYAMAAFDEGASLFSVSRLCRGSRRILIIGKDLASGVFYAGVMRKSAGPHSHITIVLDENSAGTLPHKAVTEELSRWADSVFLLDVSQPVDAVAAISRVEKEPYDFTVNGEDLMGAEAIGAFLTRSGGQLYYTSMKNSYTQSMLLTECMSKELKSYTLGSYFQDSVVLTTELLLSLRKDLDRVDHLLETALPPRLTGSKVRATAAYKAGQTAGFVFSSPVTEALINEVLNVAGYDCNVILQGETGTGKEKILSLIHRNSTRRGRPCVKINCATIQENLAESEFFGYETGAFTGAQSGGKKGYFELANGGILFLDEVGTLSLGMQSKLLRVLQENQFYRVGGTAPVNINVRVICASNVPLRQLAEKGNFREDLYYRLNICTITIPPLRERPEDISALATAFLENFCRRYGVDRELDPDALTRLTAHHWPGNVRELENLIHRAVINVKGHIISGGDIDELLNASIFDDLTVDLKGVLGTSASLDFNRIVAQQEAQLIRYAMNKCGSTRKAAAFLNMTQQQLMRKKQKYDL